MKTRRQFLVGWILVALTAVGSVSIFASDPTLSRYTIDGGGAMRSAGSDLELSGTIGQPDAGIAFGGDLQLTGGFWFGLTPGDCNSDGGVNLFDHADRVACLTGPRETLQPECACFDLDSDRDVDLCDAARFQISFTGN